jgi:hypothetical protein
MMSFSFSFIASSPLQQAIIIEIIHLETTRRGPKIQALITSSTRHAQEFLLPHSIVAVY